MLKTRALIGNVWMPIAATSGFTGAKDMIIPTGKINCGSMAKRPVIGKSRFFPLRGGCSSKKYEQKKKEMEK
jgi:hypothetical protein